MITFPEKIRKFACNEKSTTAYNEDLQERTGQPERQGGTFGLQTRRHERRKREAPTERHVPELVSGLCLVRDTGACRASHHGRTEARATAHSAFHAAHGGRALQQGGQHRGPHHAVPPPRRRLHRRRTGAAGTEGPPDRLPGNWGNILTGDSAAAPRYIEARLSKFALDVVFNPKTTEWKLSYDGRNREPVTLPVKFPLLLVQGVEGIAVGLSSKILPHNFNELCDAAVSYLHGEVFRLYPDFQTGGSIDVSKYNDGERGGSVRVRSRIEKVDNKTLAVREIPYGKTVASVCDSIVKASEKGKIKIRKVEDLTSGNVEILVHLTPGTSSDKTIDALYAFTDCEVSISPNCCVIDDHKPHFLTVSDVLAQVRRQHTSLLRRELEIHRDEVRENLHFASLEKIFIEERIYKDKEFEQSKDMDAACEHIDLNG